MKNIFLPIFLFLCIAISANAQQPGLHFMPGTWQASRTNPAFMNNKRFSFGLPHVFGQFGNNGPGYDDLVVRMDNGERLIDPEATLANFSEQNVLRLKTEIETFHVAFSKNKWQFSLYHALKTNTEFHYPKELIGMALLGNAQYIGQEVNIAPQFSSMSYNEIGLGLALQIGKLTVGGRLKYLAGMHHIGTQRNNLSLYTDDEIYQVTATADYSIRAAGAFDVQTADNISDWGIDFNDISFGGNTGMALDLGITYELNEKITLAASVLDIGGISWKKNGYEFSTTGNFTFSGIDVLPYLEDDGFSFDNTLDTLERIFKVDETSLTYGTMLPMKSYFSGTYRLNKLVRFNALVYSEFLGARSLVAGAVGANLDLGKICSFGMNYSLSSEGFQSVGANLLLNLGPIQLYTLTDNILLAMNPLSSGMTNVRLGLNVALNKKKKETE